MNTQIIIPPNILQYERMILRSTYSIYMKHDAAGKLIPAFLFNVCLRLHTVTITRYTPD